MDGIQIVQFVQRTVKERRESVVECLERNSISTMEQYQHCMGELNALSYIDQELSDLLTKQEQNDGIRGNIV